MDLCLKNNCFNKRRTNGHLLNCRSRFSFSLYINHFCTKFYPTFWFSLCMFDFCIDYSKPLIMIFLFRSEQNCIALFLLSLFSTQRYSTLLKRERMQYVIKSSPTYYSKNHEVSIRNGLQQTVVQCVRQHNNNCLSTRLKI